MTTNDNPVTAPIPVELAVAIGRIEEKLNAMSTTETRTGDRLEKIEQRLTSVELNMATNVRPKAPWYNIVGGIGAILLLALNAWAVINLGVDLAALNP